MKIIKTTTALAALTGLLLVSNAQATIVGYSVDGVGPITFTTGDTLTLGADIGDSITLTPGGPAEVGLLNDFTFTAVKFSSATAGSDTESITRDMTISLVVGSKTLTQSSTVTVTKTAGPPEDLNSSLLVLQGSPVVFTIGGQTLTVTPLKFSQDVDTTGGPSGIVSEIDATFQLSAVPEPTTVIAGALLLLPFGLSTFRALRKDKNTTTV